MVQKKKKSKDRVPGSGLGWVGYGGAGCHIFSGIRA